MKLISKILISAGVALASLSASAALVTTASHGFGDPAGTNFGGDDVSFTTLTAKNVTKIGNFSLTTNLGSVTLGLTAMNRTGGAALANDNNGLFTAKVGADKFDFPTDGLWNQNLANWDFDFYVGGDTAALLSYTYKLFIDTDRSINENFQEVSGFMSMVHPLNFGYDSLVGGTTFNPLVNGEYMIKLVAYNGGAEVGSTDITVSVIPEPASLALVGLALAGVGFASRRRKAA